MFTWSVVKRVRHVRPHADFCLIFSVLLVERDVGLLALRPQGQTALLQLRLGVVPVLVQDELLPHDTTQAHKNSQRATNRRNTALHKKKTSPTVFLSFFVFYFCAPTYLLRAPTDARSVSHADRRAT